MSNSRRDFFTRIKKHIVNHYPHSKYPRPPWAISHVGFLEKCTRCGKCVNACKQKVLTFSDERNSILKGLPILSLEYNSCKFCQNCVNVCESGALDLSKGTKKQAMAIVEHNQCDFFLGSFCNQCIEACINNAICVDNKILINQMLCQGCGECVVACTNQAISMQKLS